MNSYIPQHYAAATLFKIGMVLHQAAWSLRSVAKRLDHLIAARRKAADDRQVLSEMSERELRDIGVCGGQLHALRYGWSFEREERAHALEWRRPM